MRLKKSFSLAIAVGALALTASAALAGPLVLGPAPATAPTTLGIPLNVGTVKVQMLTAYKQVRSFWLSRAIVR